MNINKYHIHCLCVRTLHRKVSDGLRVWRINRQPWNLFIGLFYYIFYMYEQNMSLTSILYFRCDFSIEVMMLRTRSLYKAENNHSYLFMGNWLQMEAVGAPSTTIRASCIRALVLCIRNLSVYTVAYSGESY